MWETALIAASIASAVMSIALGAAFQLTLTRLGTLPAIEPAGVTTKWPVSVVVPARNEEQDLAECVRSVLNQQGVDLRVIVVNDHSTDRTGVIADALAESDSRVTVLHDPPLEPRWLGKPNAMRHGLEAAAPGYIVFSDADVMHDSRCFASALDRMAGAQLDLVSLCPMFECESLWENVLMPHALVAGTVQFLFRGVNSPDSRRAAAAGAFILTRSEVLAAIGGVEAIRAEIVDDIALARVVKRHGFQTRFWLAPHLLRVRMFKSNREAFWGLTKNILGAVSHWSLAFPAMLLPVFVYWVPLAALAVGLATGRPAMIAAGVVPWAIQAALLVLAGRICRYQWPKALLFPLAVLPVVCCFTRAIYHRLASGSVAWRGRVIAVDNENTPAR